MSICERGGSTAEAAKPGRLSRTLVARAPGLQSMNRPLRKGALHSGARAEARVLIPSPAGSERFAVAYPQRTVFVVRQQPRSIAASIGFDRETPLQHDRAALRLSAPSVFGQVLRRDAERRRRFRPPATPPAGAHDARAAWWDRPPEPPIAVAGYRGASGAR